MQMLTADPHHLLRRPVIAPARGLHSAACLGKLCSRQHAQQNHLHEGLSGLHHDKMDIIWQSAEPLQARFEVLAHRFVKVVVVLVVFKR